MRALVFLLGPVLRADGEQQIEGIVALGSAQGGFSRGSAMAARETLSRTWLMLEKKSDGLLERCTCRPDELHTSRRMDLWAGARARQQESVRSAAHPPRTWS